MVCCEPGPVAQGCGRACALDIFFLGVCSVSPCMKIKIVSGNAPPTFLVVLPELCPVHSAKFPV